MEFGDEGQSLARLTMAWLDGTTALAAVIDRSGDMDLAALRRVARLADGWLASAYNTTPDGSASARQAQSEQLAARDRDPDRFPDALATMWTWITEDASEADRVLRDVLAPMLRRDPDTLSGQLCVGPAAPSCSRAARGDDRAPGFEGMSRRRTGGASPPGTK